MKKVYIAGPYTNGNVEQNVFNAINVASNLIEFGLAPYCPHLSHYIEIQRSVDWKTWLYIDLEYLKVCDYLIRIDGYSIGADIEVKFAKENNIKVFNSILDLKKYLETI